MSKRNFYLWPTANSTWIYLLIFIFICHGVMYAQNAKQFNIKGKIVDANGEGIPGASIQIKGTTVGIKTGSDGSFNLIAPDGAVLAVSHMGFVTSEIPVNERSNYNIVLNTNDVKLGEIVVVGYGEQRKSDLTGSIVSIKPAQVMKSMPVANIESAMQGRMAGVSVIPSGDPNQGATIRIRGLSSFNNDGGPLVVIDGFVGGGLNAVGPNNIESLEVLKDASATAIYGSRAANGVILVTTRSGVAGKPRITFNSFLSFKKPPALPATMSAGEFARLYNSYGREIAQSSGNAVKVYYTDAQIAQFDQGIGEYKYADHMFNNTAVEQNYDLSVSGGSKDTKYLLSLIYNDNNGVAARSGKKTGTVFMKVDSKLSNKIDAGLNFRMNYNTGVSPSFSYWRNPVIDAITMPTTVLPKNEKGEYNNITPMGEKYNPMGIIWEMDRSSYNYNPILQGFVNVKLFKGLSFRTQQKLDFYTQQDRTVNNKFSSNYMTNRKTDAAVYMAQNRSWISSNILTYNKELQEHRLTLTGVFDQEMNESYYQQGTGVDLVSVGVGADNLSLSKTMTSTTGKTITTLMSFVGRINYVYGNRYLLTASLRRDGSSRLSPENRWQTFTAYAAAWNMDQERFLKNSKMISQWKWRLSYGETGNQGGRPYASFTELKSSRDASGNLGFSVSQMGNKNLTWERNKQISAGVDLGFFNNRATATIEYYKRTTTDALFDLTMPLYSGFTSAIANVGEIQSKGVDITLGGDPIVKNNFSWNTALTLTFGKATVEDLGADRAFTKLDGPEFQYFRLVKHEKLGTMYGYLNEGVYKSSEAAEATKYNTEPGGYKYKDINNDGLINDQDVVKIGNGQPPFNWGWNNSFSFKNIDLSLYFTGYHGFDIYNRVKEETMLIGINSQLAPTPDYRNRWIKDVNEDAKIAGFVQRHNQKTPSSQYVERGDFVRLKSITLGYTLRDAACKKWGISSLRIYGSAQNLLTFTGYSGIDPEVSLKTPVRSGLDYGYYPSGKSFVAGVNVSF
ncbi:TonB-linked SusC/RagA family outer membrane protein [Chitinophaga dinghuensis]|uniref:TonB-linked SusC/RagA family outer membrane protein n=1 Tax=Chitinophaga dinghuensis TaxID=1539050 RepID=A0A327VGT4_9BACT|nr:TonB-dependent receptor [Chitinophaga dinghuensis]RAJ72794.1 TonB-linked SusC/RagA family outer membrane protein [Chitinophaga dinghuensis]